MRLDELIAIRDDIAYDEFIEKVNQDDARTLESLRTYVVGDKVYEQLDRLLGELGARLSAAKDTGRYVYGSFGSGKSHLLNVLGAMFERRADAYELGHERLRTLRNKHPWLAAAGDGPGEVGPLLVVRVNMMDQASLTSAMYLAFNEALAKAGKPQVEVTDEKRVYALIEKDAERLGGLNALLAQVGSWLATQPQDELPPWMPRGLPPEGFAALFQTFRHADLEKRLFLAAMLQTWRNHGESSIRPQDLWLPAREGFDRLARHAKDQGYSGIAWLVDELVIWIRGKSSAQYSEQINQLSALVDHATARVVPFFVAVAVQMDIAQTCPDDLSEKDFQERLGHIRDRFSPQITLDDQDLYEVAAERVLSRRTDVPAPTIAALEAKIDAVFAQQKDAIAQLKGNLSTALVRKLYPFHPALLRILVDVTQALSRNRSAMAVLFALLSRYRALDAGQLIPAGAVWDDVFATPNLAAMKGNLAPYVRNVYEAHGTWERIAGKIDAVGSEDGGDPHLLHQLVRTVLLCQLSQRPHFEGGQSLSERVTAGMLMRLNQAEVKAVTELSGTKRVIGLLRSLQKQVLQLTMSGDTDPAVHLKTEKVDIEAILTNARSNVQHAQRFAFARKVIDEQLGLKLGDKSETPLSLPVWRGTKRTGRLLLANVRELSYAGSDNQFSAGKSDFLVIVDYPFDADAGKTRQDDQDTVDKAKSRGAQWTVAWLPDHLNKAEREALDFAAAVEVIRKDQETYLRHLSTADAAQAWKLLENHQAGRKADLENAIKRCYFANGNVAGLRQSLDGLIGEKLNPSKAPAELGAFVLNQRYPTHPQMTKRADAATLEQVAGWVLRAAKTGQAVPLKASEMELVEAIAVPLELVHKGAGQVTRRTDGQYLSAVLAWVGEQPNFEAQTLRALLMAEYDPGRTKDPTNWGFGFTREAANLFLLYLLDVQGFEAQVDGKSATVHDLTSLPEKFRLVKDEVVDSATWDAAVKVAAELFEVKGRADLPSSPEQAKLVKDAAEAITRVEAAAGAYLTALSIVAKWAGVAPERSKRSLAAARLTAFCEGFGASLGNAARARWLAVAARIPENATEAPKIELVRVRKSLATETAALKEASHQETAFEYVEAHGTQEDVVAIVTKLRNLLNDGFETSSLATLLPGWRADANAAFKRLTKNPAIVPPSVVVPPKTSVTTPTTTAPTTTAPTTTAPTTTAPTTTTITPPIVDSPEGPQATSDVITGTAAEIGATIALKTATLLAKQKGTRFRVVITVEAEDP